MLHLLDESLEAFLRRAVPLPERDVDVSFDSPDGDWGARITRPTVNLFLWDVRRNAGEAHAGTELHHDERGRPVRRTPRPRVDCRYLVTAWTSDVRDEHALLGAVLAGFLGAQEIPADDLVEGYRGVSPPPALTLAVRPAEGTPDVCSALGGQLKPGLDLVVTATVDAVRDWKAGPPVRRYELTVTADEPGARDEITFLPPDDRDAPLVVERLQPRSDRSRTKR